MGNSPIISHLISSALDAAGSISCTGENILPSPIASGLLVGILFALEKLYALLPEPVSLEFTSNRTRPFDPTWNCCSRFPKKQKSNGRAWGLSHASSIFVFTEFDNPLKGKGGTKGISTILYVFVSPICKKSALNEIFVSQTIEKSSPALTYGFPGVVAPTMTWISEVLDEQSL